MWFDLNFLGRCLADAHQFPYHIDHGRKISSFFINSRYVVFVDMDAHTIDHGPYPETWELM